MLGADRRWHDVSPADGALLVNLGDVTARWTNEKYLSTLHRVKPPIVDGTIERRRSAAFFHDGNIDALISTIPSCIGEEGELYPPITIGDNLKAKLAGSRAGQAQPAGRARGRPGPRRRARVVLKTRVTTSCGPSACCCAGGGAEDREPFAAINADPDVMEHFPATARPGRERRDGRSDRGATSTSAASACWAVERARRPATMIGFVGLSRAAVRGAFHPGRRGRLAARPRGLGSGPGDRGRSSRGRRRLRPGRADRDRQLHHGGQRALAGRHAPARHDATTRPTTSTTRCLPADHPLRRHVLYRLPSRPTA